MSREEAIYELKNAAWLGTDHSRARTEEAVEMAIQALSQVNDIKAIINNTMYIQEDVIRYQMICEVVKE